MYIPPAFAENRPEALHAIMRASSLPVLISPRRGGGLLATHLPLLLQAPDRLIGHVAKANDHWRDYDPEQESLAIFSAADGYVSPSWYPSKRVHGRVVPTWNYSVVHASGRLSVIHETGEKRAIVSALTDAHEAGRAAPWSVTDAPADFIIGQLKGIVGLALAITRLEGKVKLSQNRGEEDRNGVIAGVERENPALARAMRRARGDPA
ncbi:FMN-binding negative transcriptional regulator [Acidocella sp.]|uniref:FMN-binding negative transcriptional regulator n=1 Tax=Acidocella sp. TaxID=50710 RepID=UPI00260EF3C4|nr:FMN-binding negative transcriptional regulator [Acidocella sp.]